jgi:GT2 family glycosyltransferase
MLPKVSVIWLNYNSAHIIAVTKQSLDALFNLDYPNLELIILDNNSSDGSQQIIEEYIKKAPKTSNLKFIKTSKNEGWIGGINAAYQARDRQSAYLALTHDDVLTKADYLRKAVSFLEGNGNVGAVQGVVTKLDSDIIDSSGFMANDALELKSEFNGKPASDFHEQTSVSVVEGSMPIYRLEHLKNVLNDDNQLFLAEGFMYYLEDVYVSFKLWEKGYKCIVLPFVSGSHYRMGTIQTLKPTASFYYLMRNRIAMLTIARGSSKHWVVTQQIRKLTVSNRSMQERKLIYKALRDGLSLGKKLKKKYGKINLKNVPIKKRQLKTKIKWWLH